MLRRVISCFQPGRGDHGPWPIVHQGGESLDVRHPGTLQSAFLRGREQGDDGEVVALGCVNEAEGVGGAAVAFGAEMIVGDWKRAVEHAQDIGTRRGEQALDILPSNNARLKGWTAVVNPSSARAATYGLCLIMLGPESCQPTG